MSEQEIDAYLQANHWHRITNRHDGWYRGEYGAACMDMKQQRFFTLHAAYAHQKADEKN